MKKAVRCKSKKIKIISYEKNIQILAARRKKHRGGGVAGNNQRTLEHEL